MTNKKAVPAEVFNGDKEDFTNAHVSAGTSSDFWNQMENPLEDSQEINRNDDLKFFLHEGPENNSLGTMFDPEAAVIIPGFKASKVTSSNLQPMRSRNGNFFCQARRQNCFAFQRGQKPAGGGTLSDYFSD